MNGEIPSSERVDLFAAIEPAAAAAAKTTITMRTTEASALSMAISMRRIADALDGTNGLGIAQAIENAIGTGMFHGFQNQN